MVTNFLRNIRSAFSLGALVACLSLGSALPAVAQDGEHAQHNLTDGQFAELREKIPLYREFTNGQIMANMARMGSGSQFYLSDTKVTGNIGVLALGHGYSKGGNEAFKNAYTPIATKYPTAVAFGMAMMSSQHIQTAVDELTSAGADTVLVLPVTTLNAGPLLGQWRYIFGVRADAPWMSVPRVQSDARIVFGPTPTTGALILAILLDYAKELSRDPAKEVVALIAHGPDDAKENAEELAMLEQHAAAIRKGHAFAQVRGFTLQDDAPSAIRKTNVNQIREWIQAATDQGQRVIVLTTLPVKGNVQKKIQHDLKGLDYAMSERGIVEHPQFSKWIDSIIASIK